jgi:hypothetical protein
MTQAYPGYPPQPTAPPVQQYPMPQAYPQQPAYPQPQQFAPQYPVQQGYPAPMMAPPQQPLAQGSIDDFFNQPSAGGGKSLTFPNQQFGTRYIGIVTRALGTGDIQQQTNTQGVPQFFKDGRPKFVMKVPLQMQPSAAYPDGLATWFVKGQARDELVRAMAEAGAPAGPPEAGSIIDITYTNDRQAGAGMNPAKQFAVVYTRPSGETSSPAPAAQAAPAPVAQPPVPPVYGQVPQQPPAQQYAPPATPQAPPQQPAAPVAQPQPPADLTQEQQALLAKLTGG